MKYVNSVMAVVKAIIMVPCIKSIADGGSTKNVDYFAGELFALIGDARSKGYIPDRKTFGICPECGYTHPIFHSIGDKDKIILACVCGYRKRNNK